MKRRRAVVNDLMQKGYVYFLMEPVGENLHSSFRPDLPPKERLELGVLGGEHMADCAAEFPSEWFEHAKLSPERLNPDLNYFGVSVS